MTKENSNKKQKGRRKKKGKRKKRLTWSRETPIWRGRMPRR